MTVWAPTILDLRGFSVSLALTVTTLILVGPVVGAVIATLLADRLPAIRVAVSAGMAAAIAGALFGLSGSVVVIAIAGLVHFVLTGIFYPLLNKVMSEQWPTDLRARGNGISWSAGRLASIFAPFALAAALAALGASVIGWVLFGLWVVSATAVALIKVPGASTTEVGR
jgi:putative MFS transporter